MNQRMITRLSKKLSWLLRHGAGEEELSMDAAGWVPVSEVLGWLRISRASLEEIVKHNDKNRLQLEDERVRCCQGHSTKTMPVTPAALEDSWQRWSGETAWHGTFVDAVGLIAREGITPQSRTHVHLTAELHSVVGKRANVHVMLKIDCAMMRHLGHQLFVAPNGVLLTRSVPAQCIVGMRPLTKRARAELKALSASGVPGFSPAESSPAP